MGLLREELKGKSKAVNLTSEEDEEKEIEGPFVLESPFVLAPVRWEEEMLRSHILAPIPQMPMEAFDQALGQEVAKVSGWGKNVLGRRIPSCQRPR